MSWSFVLIFAAAVGPSLACPEHTLKKQMHSDDGNKTDACVDAAGALHGKAHTSDAAGALVAEDEWNHGVKEPAWTTFFGAARPHSRVTYAGGKRQGGYAEWDEQADKWSGAGSSTITKTAPGSC